MSAQQARVLLADIGGTNARFALADTDAEIPLHADSVREYAVADFPSLADAAQHYLDRRGQPAPGRVRRGRARRWQTRHHHQPSLG